MTSIFFELTLILILAGGIATIISFFKQPPLVAYILTGLIVGPFGYYHLHNTEVLHGLGQVGIALLLFMVGLELDVSQLKKLGPAALMAGLGQIVVTFFLALIVINWLGFAGSGSWLIAIAISFSSTVITVKLLNEKHDVHSLYGRLSLSILLLQDFAAIAILIFMAGNNTSSSITAGIPAWGTMIFTIAKAVLLIWLINWHSKYLFPKILKVIGKSDELLLVFSLAWALGLAVLVSLPFIGFSLEIGGFLAGLALAHSAVHYEISARIKTLRDFFIILFFIILGANFVVGDVSSIIIPSLILSLFVVIVKPLVIFILIGAAGYKPRTSFMVGSSLANISEFSLIVGALGLAQGRFDQTAVAVLTLTAIISIAISSYMMTFADTLYGPLGFIARWFDFRKGSAERGFDSKGMKKHIVIIGAHRLGKHLVEVLHKSEIEFVIIDQDPSVTEYYREQGMPAICGDFNDDYIQELAGVSRARLIISTVPSGKENMAFVHTMKANKLRARLIVVAEDEEEALQLYRLGIDYALLPHFIGGQHLAKIIKNDQKLSGLRHLRGIHIKTLRHD